MELGLKNRPLTVWDVKVVSVADSLCAAAGSHPASRPTSPPASRCPAFSLPGAKVGRGLKAKPTVTYFEVMPESYEATINVNFKTMFSIDGSEQHRVNKIWPSRALGLVEEMQVHTFCFKLDFFHINIFSDFTRT